LLTLLRRFATERLVKKRASSARIWSQMMRSRSGELLCDNRRQAVHDLGILLPRPI
jgi:hypothetical protein